MKNNSNFDILKFVLAIMVVCIHSTKAIILFPWLRLAVPLFFITSSYFFFNKLKNTSKKNKKDVLIKYVKRNLIYYLFWFIALLPITLIIKKWFINGKIVWSVLSIISNFIFGSTFRASWFISALIIAVILIYFLDKKFSNKTILLISFAFWLIAYIDSSYGFLLSEDNILHLYDRLGHWYLSFPVALLWVSIGKCFAEKEFITNKKINIILIIIFAILLYVEWLLIYKYSGEPFNDVYLFLIPLCTVIFNFIKNLKCLNLSFAVILRNMSAIIYPFHKSLIYCIKRVFNHFDIVYANYQIVILTLVICFIVSFVIIKLSRKKYFSFLKYAY